MTQTPAEHAVPSRRERARAATIAEIKETALRVMRETGTTDVRFSDIAREMGMTAPALYRYFADSDALLTELIVDAFDDLGSAVAAARDAVPEADMWQRLLAVSEAYRSWARREPQQFALILGMPVPGYAAPDEGPTTEAAKRAMGQLQALFVEALRLGKLGPAMITDVDPAFIAGWETAHADDELPNGMEELGPATLQAMLNTWASLHGFTSLEAYNHLDWLPEEARDALFVTGVRLAARAAGLPESSPPSEPRTSEV
jgi:AcrR family transcriptional regulator